ncbi:tetratricopeptide repeat protein [Nonomuraea africana]|uniref:tetratricopeptide repeat protein n=1 Tax=Nonomuraea africana TaxID=46171 RepID=UPI0033FAFFE3
MNLLSADADGRLHGVYAVAATLAHALVPVAMERHPELVAAHDVELRAIAPDLHVPARRQSIAAQLAKSERILIPGSRHTLRIANGLAEFVRDHLAAVGPMTLTVTNADRADAADREFLEVVERRLDGSLLEIVKGDASPYEPLAPEEHDRLADELEESGLIRPQFGEIAFHRERGGDRELAVKALWGAMSRCLMAGFHHATADFGERALALLDPGAEVETWWRISYGTALAYSATDREDAARALFDEARRRGVEPKARATAAYATAMSLVRHHVPARRDPEEAMAWINEAITITSLLPDRRERAFHLSFDLNGAALVQTRRDRLDTALELVEEAIALADRDLGEGEHPIHRLVLRANRASLLTMMGDPEGALPDLDAAISADPGYPDYYIERGNLLNRLGRTDEAVADYETAMRVGLPFPEPYYNRAEIRFAAGDLEGALTDLGYVLELDPEFVDAYINRSGIWAALGEYEKARADAVRGLELDPRNAYLLSALGQAEAATGRQAEAWKAFEAALEIDPRSAATLASRGALAYETGDLEAAVADLGRAIELEENPTFLFNRAVALRDLGRTETARFDLARAAELDPEDADVRKALEELEPI